MIHPRVMLLVLLLFTLVGSISGHISSAGTQQTRQDDPPPSPNDSTSPPRYRVAKTIDQRAEELKQTYPADLRTPSNIRSEVEYDPANNTYLYRTWVGNREIGTPIVLTQREYLKLLEQRDMATYFRSRANDKDSSQNKAVDLKSLQFSLGPADRIFGPGGVQIQTQGSAEISAGVKRSSTNNPSLPINSRNKTYFDFNEKVQLNINAKVGDKMNFNMNYDTEATFDFDSKKLKLAYEGKEDEIVKLLEAGNVSMNTSSSLIRGTQALFGIKTGLQFGKLKATAVISQQESESKTLNMQGGAQLTPFQLTADQYDENRHFFLSQFFYRNYNQWMSKLPYISSGVTINRVEVWVTNKRGNYDQARNIVAFLDMAENEGRHNTYWATSTTDPHPTNGTNTLYKQMTDQYLADRNISTVNQNLEPLTAFGINGGIDFEKVENARRLDPSEYRINTQLGYISLNSALQPDEVLGVAFEYAYRGQTFQVGEFSTDNTGTGNLLLLKMLKGSLASPQLPSWRLMMKNIYSLNAYQVQADRFRLDIKYQTDSTGTYTNYISEGQIKNQILLRVMNLDRLDSRQEPNPDGFYDLVEGYTVYSQNGKVIFPVTEPFGSWLAEKIGDPVIARKYAYTELYDSTLTIARQIAEKNKFLMTGEYKASSGSTISLGAMNVPRGSVRVTAGGIALTENIDYTVDYSMGSVTILNQSILDSRTPVSVSMENQSTYSMQRKTLLGLDLQYEFNKNFNMYGTVMHLSEKPLTKKVNMGNEPISNTIWGMGISYKGESQWLTNLIDKIPTVTATQPSRFSIQAEVAQLIPGHPKDLSKSGIAYIDDFEATQTGMDLRTPYAWTLCSTPYDPSPNALFPEAAYNNDPRYGMNRSLLAWYRIDNMFTQNTPQTPVHIRKDKEQLSNHFVRQVLEQELFPSRQAVYGQTSILPVMNLAFYPNERGPYNVDVEGVNSEFLPVRPEKRWGGIMRKMDNTDFEAANYEYIQFWLMDPFVYDQTGGGDLYFNLGEVSEDVLKDGKKFFENGMPINSDTLMIERTAWGKVPTKQSLVYAFDNTPGTRKLQDVGLNGLSTPDEFEFPTYGNYVNQLEQKLSEPIKELMRNDPFSPLNDPAGDNFHHYRGTDYDNAETDILTRYKRYNGVEGNSTASEDSPESYDISAKTTPDVEDINQDNTLNGYERYFEYKVSLRPTQMQVGQNYIVDIQETTVRLANGQDAPIKWYQFKIPIRDYDKVVGSIRDFKTIRFMRMFLTNFQKNVVLRFGTFELVRGDWRAYTQPLNDPKIQPITNGTLDVSAVNIEENGSRKPVNYVLPPGIDRMIDPSQPQLRQLNEQSLSLAVNDLAPGDARAVYKNSNLDMRQYNNIQMFVHAEALIGNDTELKDGDTRVFIRLGSDYKNNYYEYEIPLSLTPEGKYNTNDPSQQEIVWPKSNMLDIPLSVFTDLKLHRNAEKRKEGSHVSFTTLYSETDPNKQANKISMIGNPSLAEVKTIMVGIRNTASRTKSAVIWINELRMTSFNEQGGWAAKANLSLSLSDIATINASGQFETVGFGSIEEKVQQRRMDDMSQYNIATTVELGRLVPEKVKLKAPLYYNVSEQKSNPKYNPLDKDILLSETLDGLSGAERDSVLDFAQDRTTTTSFSLSNVRFDIRSKNPMPYDPANFSFGYMYSQNYLKNPTTQYEVTKNYKGNINYSYAPVVKPFQPFTGMKNKSKNVRFIREFGINYLPTSVTFSTNMSRYYYEQQLRELSSGEVNTDIPLNFRKDFMWDRQFSLVWNISKSLRFDINTGTNARIDEPNVPVNKRLFPDEYEMWKDSVWNNILSFGRPMNYTQTANFSYDLPLSLLPATDWITAGVKYNSSYNWDRGAMIDSTTEIGNVIKNQGAWQFNGRLGLETLYNKSRFLREVNQKFSTRSMMVNQSRLANSRGGSGRSPAKPSTPVKKRYQKNIVLSKDSTVTILHNLDNKNLFVKARRIEGRDSTHYPVKYKTKGRNAIQILNRDSATVYLTITQGPRPEETPLYQAAQYGARLMMMVRSVGISYRLTNSMMVPYFRPEIGGMFGQGNVGGLTPGLDFAFGFADESYLRKAHQNNWLITNDSLVTPASVNKMEEFQFTASLEPVVGLKIELNANRVANNNQQIQFMFDDSPTVRGGNFTMTTIALTTMFESSSVENNYNSAAFDALLQNREIIADRLQQLYNGTTYPDKGFLKGDPQWAGKPYDPVRGKVDPNSADVLVPAFIAAYTGRSADKVDLTPFPTLKRLLPNWKMTYSGMMAIPFFKQHFKRFDLSHAYRCTYSVGSFTSYQNWADLSQDDLGFIRDVQTGNPTPSSPFSISAAAITESFAPLLGIDATLQNNITFRAEYRDTRNVSMNISSNQVVEARSEDVTVGSGYKIANFKGFFKNPVSKKQSTFSTDLNLRADLTYSLKNAYIRRIATMLSEPTSGNSSLILKLSVDYMLSRSLTLRAYYDKQITKPLVSSTAFPVSNSNFGVSVKFMMTR